MSIQKQYLRVAEVAEILGITTNTVRAYCDTNKLRYFRTPGNQRRILKADVDDLLAMPAGCVLAPNERLWSKEKDWVRTL